MKRTGIVMPSRRHGMSLLEVSIVIAVIGLLAGAILAGRDLARLYAMRKVLLEANSYVVSVQQFKVKYGALPGDMPNAVQVWGKADGDTNLATNCASPLTDISNGAPTCNGDGNGLIEATNCEHYRVWQQMSAGEFIVGKFTGVSGLAGCTKNSQPGVNVPQGAVDATGYSITSFPDITSGGDPLFFDGNYANTLMFGGTRAGDYSINPALTAEEAAKIDGKADDGVPALGNIRMMKPATSPTPSCLTAGNAYNLINPAQTCAMLFLNGYLRNPGAQ